MNRLTTARRAGGLALLAPLLLLGCQQGTPAGAAPTAGASQAASAAGQAASAAVQAATQAASAASQAASAARQPASAATAPAGDGGHGAGNKAKWDGPVQWEPWEAGLARAAAEKKRVMLVVYADWCPRCRELAPVFADAAVAELAKGVVMVRQDSDAKPAWLERYAEHGSYVPRIFFLEADGSLVPGITSGHPRYPYFFSSGQVEAIKAAMKKAAEG